MYGEGFRFYKPCGLLQPYIRYYWAFESRRPLNVLTFPVGCTQLIFHRGAPLFVPELGTAQYATTVSGQVDFPSHLCSGGHTEMIVTVFRPHAMRAFLHEPVGLFHNREIAGCDLGNRSLNELADRIGACGDPALCVGLVERWLLRQLRTARTDRMEADLRRMEAAVKTLCSAPRSSVAELASGACLSRKQFERLFRSYVGINPKEYACIVRFHRALNRMRSGPERPDQAQIAYACGYADQSHFIREFRRFSGHTPLGLLKTVNCSSDLFSDPA